MDKSQKGFTTLDLIISLGIVTVFALFVGLIIGLINGNFWFTESGVLKELTVDHPQVEKILMIKRYIYDESEIVVLEKGVSKTYFLDTDIFWNYEFHTDQLRKSKTCDPHRSLFLFINWTYNMNIRSLILLLEKGKVRS